MKRAMDMYKIIIVLISIMMISGPAVGQDLGSTSGLFRSKSATKKEPATKTSTPAKKSSPAKRSAPAASKRRTTSAKRSSQTPRKIPAEKNAGTAAKTESPAKSEGSTQIATNRARKLADDVVITVGGKVNASPSQLMENAIAEGNTARNRRLYVEAEEAYMRAGRLVPQDSRALYGLGNIYSDQQRWEEAEASYRKALAIEPDSPTANIALSYVLTQPVVGSNLGERYIQAEQIARKAIQLDPNNAVGYDQLGVALELRGNISDETRGSYMKALELDPSFALAYAHLGRLMRKRGLTNESSAAYREAIKHSVNAPTMILVADVMQSQQRYLDSEQLLREALRRDPRNPTALYLLGRALITRRNYDEAESILTESISVSPHSFVSYTMLGSLYVQIGDLSKAEQTLNRALVLVSDNEKRRLALEFESIGDGFMKGKKNSDAARVYRTAISLDSEKSSLPVKLAIAESRR